MNQFEFYNFRRQISPNIKYEGVELVAHLSRQHEGAFVYLIEESRIDDYTPLLSKLERDFDVLQERLGTCTRGTLQYFRQC